MKTVNPAVGGFSVLTYIVHIESDICHIEQYIVQITADIVRITKHIVHIKQYIAKTGLPTQRQNASSPE